MKKILLVFTFLLFFSVPALAQGLYQYSVNIEIFENKTAHYTTNLIFTNYTEKTFSLPLGEDQYNLIINSSAKCKQESKIFGTEIVCETKEKQFNILVEYLSKENVKLRYNYFVFSDSFKIPVNTEKLFILVKLPEGSGLVEIEKPYSPETAKVLTDEYARRPLIVWEEKNLKVGQEFDISIAFEKIGGEDLTGLFKGSLFVFALIIILILFSFKFFWEKYGKSVKLVLPVLKKDEKKIFEIILKHGSEVNQKIIVNESGYSKAKVSKVLKSLQERNIIKLERIGRKNKVYLKKEFEKKK